MTKPIWLIDWDGVFNIIGIGQDEVAAAWGDTRLFKALEFTIQVSPKALDLARSWMDEGLVDARWLTTWEDQANEHLVKEIGWPELPVEGRRAESKLERPRKFSESHHHYREDVGWWKLEFAQSAHATGVPVIWSDDEISTVPSAMSWISEVGTDRLLPVSPWAGLTPEHMGHVEKFLRRHQS